MGYNPFYNIENPELMGYEYAWTSFIKTNKINSAIISDAVAESWRRCRKLDIEFDENNIKPLKAEDLDEANSDFLKKDAKELMRDIIEGVDSSYFYGIITDSKGKKLVGLKNEGEDFNDHMKIISEINDFSEFSMGTNCFSVVSKTKKPSSVAGAQHFLSFFHRFAGYAAPIFSADGKMIGMVGIYTTTERMGDYVLSFVVAIERAIENSLKLLNSRDMVVKQNEEKQYLLDTVSDGVMYVDFEGKITQGNRRFFELFEKNVENVVGKDVSVLKTKPGIKELKECAYSTRYNNLDKKISIINNYGETIDCFFNKYKITGYGGKNKNEIWIFTVYSDIKRRAKKLSAGNTSRFTFDDIKCNSKPMKTAIEMAKKAASPLRHVLL